MQLKSEIRKLSNPEKAKTFQWFFKTGPGQYGAGDKFLGLTTPQMRTISRKYKTLPLSDIQQLIKSPYHEDRSIAIQILVLQFPQDSQKIYEFYLKNTKYINNWDLVDISAPKIVGAYLLDKSPNVLFKLAKSDNLWERRIAIISTFAFLYQGRFQPTLQISEMLLHDQHDLIHKAVGWMLREVGKKCSLKILTEFLDKHSKTMPRTMLRYSIEKFPEPLRQHYLKP